MQEKEEVVKNKKIKRFTGPNATQKIIEELLKKKLNEKIEIPENMEDMSPEEKKKVWRRMLKQKEKQTELKQLLKQDLNKEVDNIYVDKVSPKKISDPVACRCFIYSIFLQAKLDYNQEPKHKSSVEDYLKSDKFFWHCELTGFDPSYMKRKILEEVKEDFDIDKMIDVVKSQYEEDEDL